MHLFDDFVKDLVRDFDLSTDWLYRAELELRDQKDHYILELDVPGIKKEDLTVEVKDSLLIVKGKRGERVLTKSFTLPKSIDSDKIEAELKDGVLALKLHKTSKSKGKQIEIK